MDRVVFHTYYANGDIHVTRTYVQDIMEQLPQYSYFYYQNKDKVKTNWLKDIPKLNVELKTIDSKPAIKIIGNTAYINTWYGTANGYYYNNAPKTRGVSRGCSQYILYDIFKDVYKELKIPLKELEFYYPKINFENIDLTRTIANINKIDYKTKILVSNGNVTSGQSINFDFNPIIDSLGNKYPDIAFLMTDSSKRLFKNNIFYTSDITEIIYDLNEIAYISKFCKFIIGRSSGPWTFSCIADNLEDPNKIFFSFAHEHSTAVGWPLGEPKAKMLWSNRYKDMEKQLEVLIDSHL